MVDVDVFLPFFSLISSNCANRKTWQRQTPQLEKRTCDYVECVRVYGGILGAGLLLAVEHRPRIPVKATWFFLLIIDPPHTVFLCRSAGGGGVGVGSSSSPWGNRALKTGPRDVVCILCNLRQACHHERWGWGGEKKRRVYTAELPLSPPAARACPRPMSRGSASPTPGRRLSIEARPSTRRPRSPHTNRTSCVHQRQQAGVTRADSGGGDGAVKKCLVPTRRPPQAEIKKTPPSPSHI